jgi:NAD(P)H-flavin reductase
LAPASGCTKRCCPAPCWSLDGPYGTFIGDPAVETPILCMAAGNRPRAHPRAD